MVRKTVKSSCLIGISPKILPSEDEDWLNVFIYLDSDDKLIATTEKPKSSSWRICQFESCGSQQHRCLPRLGFAQGFVAAVFGRKASIDAGEYCVVHVYLDKHTKRITATARLDRYLDKTPANYQVGQEVDLLVAEATDMGFKAIINNKHWGLIHKNEVFKFLRPGKEEKGFIKEIRADGNISLSLQPVGQEAASSLNSKILAKLRENNGSLPVSDKSDPAVISNLFGVSKGNFKKAIGALYKQGQIVIHSRSH